MTTKKIKTGAPMPNKEETIANNPMKFYTYLVCISGLASYPQNTRMFRQKNLMLTKIKKTIGITDRTAKQYMYELEQEGLIQYQGEVKYLTVEEEEIINNQLKTVKAGSRDRKYRELAGAALWKRRNKMEKDGVYYIPRPNQWTPIPEETLETLNEFFECSELEIKLYLACCSYRDLCAYRGETRKIITFESIKDVLNLKDNSHIPNQSIRRALCFLKAIGLIEFTEAVGVNRKGARIPSFILTETNYYIDYRIEEIKIDENDADQVAVKQRLLEKAEAD